METLIWILVALVVIGVLVGLFMASRRRKIRLQDRFGPEYERVQEEKGGRMKAERELSAREKRREKLDIRPLRPEEHERFTTSWATVQGRFVDAPAESVREADTLVQEVMRARGYPVDNFDQRSGDVSVDHPEVVENYRAGHAISMAHEHGKASTEDLRQGMVHYRALFAALLEYGEPQIATHDTPPESVDVRERQTARRDGTVR
ncbi:MAG: type II secretion system protein [Actinomycetota bacterium]